MTSLSERLPGVAADQTSEAMAVEQRDGVAWVPVAPLPRLPVDRGVAALVAGRPIAVFRLGGDEILAIDNVDPFSGASVLARGLVGSAGDRVTVASPLHKQRFDLRTGVCVDDPSVAVRTWSATVRQGMVVVAHEPNEAFHG